jgi:hypothetical protein
MASTCQHEGWRMMIRQSENKKQTQDAMLCMNNGTRTNERAQHARAPTSMDGSCGGMPSHHQKKITMMRGENSKEMHIS